jgi:hypothetical protein
MTKPARTPPALIVKPRERALYGAVKTWPSSFWAR